MNILEQLREKIEKINPRSVIKTLSIRRLLISWAITCSTSLVLIAIAIITLNNSISTSQERLLEETLPIENASKNIINTVNDYIQLKSNILNSQSVQEIALFLDRRILDQKYLRDINFLSQLAKDNPDVGNIYQELRGNYKIFNEHFNILTKNKHSLLINSELLEKKIEQLEELVKNIQNHVDDISGKLDLEQSKTRRNLKAQATAGTNKELNKLILEKLFKSNRDEQILNNQIQISVGVIVQLARKIIYEDNRDILINIRDNQIIQEKNFILSNLELLETRLIDNNDLYTLVQKIKNDNLKLIKLLLESNSSIFQIRLQGISINNELEYSVNIINNNIDTVKIKLEKLSLATDQLVNEINAKFHKDLKNTSYIVVTISGLLLLFILSGIALVLFRINRPLEKLSTAMDNLANGILTTRLNEKEFARDEFIAIASDFNHFAYRNQKLIEELSDAKEIMAESEQRTRAILENALVGIAHLRDRQFISVNQRFEEMFGYNRNEIIGLFTDILFENRKEYETVGQSAYPLMKTGKTYKGEWRVKRKDGSIFWAAISAKPIETFAPEKGTIWLYEDITQQKDSENQLKQLANYDLLTDLPNRTLFMDRLRNNIERAKRSRESLALLFIDLDRFKQVNDSLGHAAGDKLLQGIAKRLIDSVRASDTVARLGGDEFVILLTAIRNTDIAAKHAKKIIEILSKPILVNTHEIIISPSIGVSVFPNDGFDEIQLLKNADSAMYHAKSAGRNNYQFYTEAMNDRALHRLTMERNLRQAVEKNNFLIYLQPFVKTNGQELVGYEALLRWQDETRLVPPVEFIPILEETGLIKTVGEWVLEKACKNIMMINNSLNTSYRIAVNVSARQFQHVNIVENITNIIKRTKIEPSLIDLEITESLLMEGMEKNRHTLFALHDLGIHISLDDFGTGYSSLAYLKQFPIDKLKIDKSFVQDILHESSDTAICEAILAIANSLNIEVIAEGVETYEQLNFLTSRNCQYAQGYLFGKPEPLSSVILVKKDKKNIS